MPKLNKKNRTVLGLCSLALALVPSLAWLSASVLSAGPEAPAVNTYQLATESENIRVFSLASNDIVFNPADEKIYASVPSSAGGTGNSIKPIDPRTGVVGNPVFIGSEPNKLALSNDGQSLYVALDGAFAVRRFNTATQTAGAQFTTLYKSTSRYKVADLAVSPNDPNVVAVGRVNVGFSPPGEGVAVFNNGIQLSQTTPGHVNGSDSIVFSPAGTTLYGTGQSHGLKQITVTATGATVATSSTVASGTKIKYSGGKIFSSKGDVADAAASTLLGVFPGSINTPAFVPDTAVGRAYYVVKDTTAANTWILKAYDVNTFTLAGSLTISGVSGDAASLIRWGGNGLAFRTTGGQLFILQTDLIPSGEPIPTSTVTPTPTVTPAGTPLQTRMGSVPVFANNLVYHTGNNRIYASVPSGMGNSGNSVAIIEPVGAFIENRVYVGSEPNKLALSSDNQKLYVGLDGARQVREFNIADRTAGTQFSVGVDSREGPWTIGGMAASPDDPNQIAISRFSAASTAHGGDAVFDSGIARPAADGESGSIAYSATSSTLYGLSSQATLEIMPVTGTGISAVTEAPFDYSGFNIKSIKYSDGLVYNSKGAVMDPATRALVGTYDLSLDGSVSANTMFAVDNEHNRIFFLVTVLLNQVTYIRAYELDTFLPIGSIIVPPGAGTVTDFERWGSNGLAISHSNAQLLLIRSTLVNPNEPVPAVTPTPFPPTPTPTPPPPPVFVRRVDQLANDMALNPADGKLYVSVPGIATGGTGNTITRISPTTGEILSSVFVGSEPVKLGMADDGQTLYVGLNGPKAIRRYDMSTQTAGLQFPYTLGSATTYAQDLGVVPGSPDSLVIGTGSGGAAIYDNGVKRPLVPTRVGGPQIAPIGPLEFSSPGIMYGYNSGDTGFDLYKVSVVPNGLSTVSSIGNLITGFSQALSDIKFAEGRIYTTTGRVVNPETNTITGTFPNASGKSVAVDTALRRVFIAVGPSISVFDMDTYLKVGDISLPNLGGGTVNTLVRWGANGLALRVYQDATHQHILLIQSPLVSTAATVPVGFNLNAAAYTTAETSGERVVSVTRTGEYNTPVNVHYETVDGTALAGSDYVAVSGTLSFGPGEVSKSFSVPITNDNVFEPTESFTVKLTDPAGGEAYLLSPSTGTVSISSDDPRPGISDDDMIVDEGPAGNNTVADIPVRLTNPSTETVSVNYATASGTAVAGADFQSASGVLTFAPGETVKIVPVTIIGDTDPEGNENFLLNLTGPVNGTIARAQATVIIVDYVEPNRTRYDFDGDGKADVSLFRPSEGNWYLLQSTAGFLGFHFGAASDKLAPADYDGDGKTDFGVFRPSENTWYIQNSTTGFTAANFGIAEDIPQSGDFDGDGKAEIALWRPSEGNWYTMNLATGETTGFHFGTSGDKPVVGDYDGDGKMDYAVYRPSEGNWYLMKSTEGFSAFHFGVAEDMPVPADYDGDGKTDFGVFRPSEGNWYLMKSTEGFTAFHWGLSADLPAPADYDGDGKADIAVFRDGQWHLQQTTNGYTVVNFGLAGDKPAPNAFVY